MGLKGSKSMLTFFSLPSSVTMVPQYTTRPLGGTAGGIISQHRQDPVTHSKNKQRTDPCCSFRTDPCCSFRVCYEEVKASTSHNYAVSHSPLLYSFSLCCTEVMAPSTESLLTLLLMLEAVPNSSANILATLEIWSLGGMISEIILVPLLRRGGQVVRQPKYTHSVVYITVLVISQTLKERIMCPQSKHR